MLPGFRFLLAAIVLSMSILIFGLGAAALLRAAHEEFASIPARRAPPEPVFARQTEAPVATLALLRVEPIAEKAPDAVSATAALLEQAAEAVPVPPVETQQLAALRTDDSAPPETAKPEIAIVEAPPSTEAAPVQADTPAPAEEIRIAAIAETVVAANQAAPPSRQASAPASPEANIALTKIATLGGPAVIIEKPVSAKTSSAKADRNAIRKQLRAQRAKERRRLAQRERARLARLAAASQQQAASQQPADPFTQPAITTRRR